MSENTKEELERKEYIPVDGHDCLCSHREIIVKTEEEKYQDALKEEEERIEKENEWKKKLSKTIKFKRNDQCPCGSGKKFKKCCINKISNRQPLGAFQKIRNPNDLGGSYQQSNPGDLRNGFPPRGPKP